MDSVDRLEVLVSSLDAACVKAGSVNVTRAYINRVLQWRVAIVVNHGLYGKELNSYGPTGRDAIAAMEQEVATFLRQRGV